MITDLVQIKTLGEKKRDENFRFRKHMKSRDHSDRILRRIAEEIEGRIDCTVCANCCKVATVQVSERDVERLARYLRIPPERFLAEYTAESQDEGRVLKRDTTSGCVFLNGFECTVYDSKPDICSRFPHLVRGHGSIASRMWKLVDRACYCPIVYNSLEAFKEELRFRH
jgi:Fe-S-cluster containining protein